ncbi:MAG: ASPIC/UnbV domain-containing protein [Fulvivirga sp.]
MKLIGEECNKDAYGSRVILYVDGRKLVREVDGGSSHASHNSSIVHFGLDSYSKVDSLEVRWNGGRRQIEKDIVINQTNFIQEDTSIEIITDLIEDRSNNKLITVFPNPLESSILLIKGEEVNLPSKVSILSTRGNIVKQNIQLTNNQVDLSELPIGIYILSIEVKGEVVFKKILKTK